MIADVEGRGRAIVARHNITKGTLARTTRHTRHAHTAHAIARTHAPHTV